MPSSAIEDYLKCIYTEQQANGDSLVPTGQIASALQVAPGTATAMMKTLSESGLVSYEPYSGVRLTPAGSKLALHVLRRHRLVELFLVQVMKMDWSEVHEEAEVLEHAVSDRLIERMDEILGHPSVDPHGDPIPSAAGTVDEPDHPSLLKCPLHRPLAIARVTDQRAEFLQLLERHALMPGRIATVQSRDELTETVEIRPDGGSALQLGYHAAARILVATS